MMSTMLLWNGWRSTARKIFKKLAGAGGNSRAFLHKLRRLSIWCLEVIKMPVNNVRPGAVAYLRGNREHPLLRGSVKFFQQPGGILVTAAVSGLPKRDGFYGFHIHSGSSCTGLDFPETMGHFNPLEAVHPNHAGDLPPLLGCNGRAYMQVLTDRFSMRDILGRTVVIHSGPDDFKTQPAGDSGTKIACGQIQRN